MKNYINKHNFQSMEIILFSNKPAPGFQELYFNYNSTSKDIQPDSLKTVKELHVYLTTSTAFAEQCAPCHKSYDNMLDAVKDYRAHCSGIPLFESDANSLLESIAGLDGSRDDVMANCDKLQPISAGSDRQLRIRNAAFDTYNICHTCLPRIFPMGEYAQAGLTSASQDVEICMAVEYSAAIYSSFEYIAVATAFAKPVLECSLGGSNSHLVLYRAHFKELTEENFRRAAHGLLSKLTSIGLECRVQCAIDSSYYVWSDPDAQYNGSATVLEADELMNYGSCEALSSPGYEGASSTGAEEPRVEAPEGVSEPDTPGGEQACEAVSLCLDEFDIDELTTYDEPSEANFCARSFLKRGWLEDFPFDKELVSAAVDDMGADLLLDSTMAVRSALFTNCRFWNSKTQGWQYLNLSLIQVGSRASGKSNSGRAISMCSMITENDDKEMEEAIRKHNRDMVEYNRAVRKNSGEIPERPEKPKKKYFVHSADTTTAALIEGISATNGEGIIDSNEIDVLTASRKSRFGGGMSAVWKLTATNEEITCERKGEERMIRCKNPHVALRLSAQWKTLREAIGDDADGLLSRFLFLAVPNTDDFDADLGEEESEPHGRSVVDVINNYTSYFTERYYALHNREKPLIIKYSPTYNDELRNFFDKLKKTFAPETDFFHGVINRSLDAIRRLAAIWALSRCHEPEWYSTAETLYVNDRDIRLAVHYYLHRFRSLVQVAHRCYSDKLNGDGSSDYVPPERHAKAMMAYVKLPEESFSHAEARNAIGSNDKDAYRRLKDLIKMGLVENVAHGKYRKVVQ